MGSGRSGQGGGAPQDTLTGARQPTVPRRCRVPSCLTKQVKSSFYVAKELTVEAGGDFGDARWAQRKFPRGMEVQNFPSGKNLPLAVAFQIGVCNKSLLRGPNVTPKKR